MLFLSYPGRLSKEADALARALTARGVPVFCSAVKGAVPPGESHGGPVTEALAKCQDFAILVDRSTLTPHTENEVDAIYRRISAGESIRVFPLLLDGVREQDLDYRLAGRQAYRIDRWPVELTSDFTDSLIRDLRLHVSLATVAVPDPPAWRKPRGWLSALGLLVLLTIGLLLYLDLTGGCREAQQQDRMQPEQRLRVIRDGLEEACRGAFRAAYQEGAMLEGDRRLDVSGITVFDPRIDPQRTWFAVQLLFTDLSTSPHETCVATLTASFANPPRTSARHAGGDERASEIRQVSWSRDMYLSLFESMGRQPLPLTWLFHPAEGAGNSGLGVFLLPVSLGGLIADQVEALQGRSGSPEN